MWIENPIFREDMEQIIHSRFIPWDRLDGKTIFITGATGLIGYYLVSALMYKMLKDNIRIQVLALVRNEKKARDKFEEQIRNFPENLKFLSGNLEHFPEIKENVDLIIHAGGPTASRFFAENPVETINISIEGMRNILNMAREKHIAGMVYLSSMEIYGVRQEDDKIKENAPGYINTMAARNSYPESKRLCESLAAAYFSEYKVPVNVLRLTQTFGPGVARNDQRVFAQFMRAAAQKTDIVLLTEGKTKRSYLYLADAVTAILVLLLSDRWGEAYNAANEQTYCTIREMADLIAREIAGGKVQVRIQEADAKQLTIFLPTAHTNLDTQKLRALGWSCKTDLKTMFQKTMACW